MEQCRITLRHLWPLLQLWIFSFMVALPLYAAPARTFSAARQAFENGDYNRVMDILSPVLKNHPDHGPSRILLAQSFFRLGDVNKAQRLLQGVPLSTVSPDASLDVGLILFASRRYSSAIQVLAKVPARSAQRDLARFYGGASFMHLKQWGKAASLLRSAERLPAALRTEKRQLLRDIERYEQQERAGRPEYSTPITQVAPPVADYLPATPAAAPVAAGPAKGSPDKGGDKGRGGKGSGRGGGDGGPAKPGFSASLTPSIGYNQRNTRTENHGYSTKDAYSNTKSVGGNLGLKYGTSPINAGGPMVFSLKLEAKYVDDTNTDRKGTLTANQDDPDAVFTSETVSAEKTIYKVDTKTNPELAVPVGENVDLIGGYNLNMSLPKSQFKDYTQTRGPYGTADVDMKIFTVKGTVKFAEAVTKEGDISKTTTDETIVMSKNFDTTRVSFTVQNTDVALPAPVPTPTPDPSSTKPSGSGTGGGGKTGAAAGGDFSRSYEPINTKKFEGAVSRDFESSSLSFTTGMQQNTPQADLSLKENSERIIKLELGFTYNFPLGVTPTTSIGMARLQGFTLPDVDAPADKKTDSGSSKMVVKTDGEQRFIKFQLKLAPISWFSFQVGYDYTQNTYEPPGEVTEAFERAVASQVSTSSYGFTISKTF